ncbi:MAG TPA: glycoside hydrolase family 16 protein, partial [Rhodothermia bacterium]
MDMRLFSVLCMLLATAGCSADPDDPDDGASIEGWKLVWSDEFSREGQPDFSKWSYNVGGHGWGNNELQYYTESRLKNARVESGRLIIEAHKEPVQGREYSSARLVTKDKGDWMYGRIEVRAKLPSGRGTWPAIWMLASQDSYGDGYWPDNGEIDIMEHVGYDPD